MDDYFDNPPERITRFAGSFDCSLHFLASAGPGNGPDSPQQLPWSPRTIDIGTQLVNLTNKADDLDAVLGAKPLLGDSTGGDPTDGLTGTRSTAALPVSNAVLHLIGIIGMRGLKTSFICP